MASLIAASALAPVAKKIIPGLKNGGGATKARKKMKVMPVDSANRGKYSLARKKGGKVTRKRRGRVKR